MPYTITITDESDASSVAELTGVSAETLLSDGVVAEGNIELSPQSDGSGN